MPLPADLWWIVGQYLTERTLRKIHPIISVYDENFWRHRARREGAEDVVAQLARHYSWMRVFFPILKSPDCGHTVPGAIAYENNIIYDRWGRMRYVFGLPYCSLTTKIDADITQIYSCTAHYMYVQASNGDVDFIRVGGSAFLRERGILSNVKCLSLTKRSALYLDTSDRIWFYPFVPNVLSGYANLLSSGWIPIYPFPKNCLHLALTQDTAKENITIQWFLLEQQECVCRIIRDYSVLKEHHFTRVSKLIRVNEHLILMCRKGHWLVLSCRNRHLSMIDSCFQPNFFWKGRAWRITNRGVISPVDYWARRSRDTHYYLRFG